ncbi:MAG: hypothetical protein RLZZ337_103 [Bacteroidota bacterium]|jgi:4-amino-4-deoxy-L-arabinose transferase-like glycosyltransferase
MALKREKQKKSFSLKGNTIKLKTQNIFAYILVVLSFLALSVPIWLKVDYLPVRLWDEARNAVNAIEMLESGDLIVRTFNNEPETYNLKPPLLTWMQIASLSAVGINELAIRLPSVLASIGSLVLVFAFVYSETKKPAFGILAIGILATSSGFYGEHVGRFGDHDALLVFFCCLLLFAYWQYLKSQKPKWLYITGLAVCLGILTKSISILLFGPALLLYLIFSKNFLPLFKNKHFYLSSLLAIIPVFIYYFIREKMQPGFLSLVWNDELFPRYLNTSKNLSFSEESFWYYFKLWPTHFAMWVYLLPIIIPAYFLSKKKGVYHFLLLSSALFLIIISKGTKNFWYDAPIFPLLALLVTFSVYDTSRFVVKNQFVQIAMIWGILYFPYKASYQDTLNTQETYYNWETYGISYYLKHPELRKNLNSNTKILLDDNYGFEPHLFYVKKLEKEEGFALNRKWINQVNVGDTLLITHLSTYDALKKNFKTETLDSLNDYTKRVVLH